MHHISPPKMHKCEYGPYSVCPLGYSEHAESTVQHQWRIQMGISFVYSPYEDWKMGNYQKAQPSPFNAGVINDLCCIPLYFECALVQKQLGIFNYLHFRDTWVSFPFLMR